MLRLPFHRLHNRNHTWGSLHVPTGFVERHADNTVWWIQAGWEDRIPGKIFSLANPPSAIRNLPLPLPTQGGRGPIQRIEINAHQAMIVRRYHRGGFVRHFIHDIYWDRPPRPFVELCCTEEARRRGVPTVEVLGAQVEWLAGGFYRGLLVTQEATGFHNLWKWLHLEKSSEHRQQMLTAVAHAIAAMHQLGISHADLNPTNILIDPASGPLHVRIIDFDCARLFSQRVPTSLRESNLHRFQRFFRKHDIHEQWLTPAEFEHLCQRYHAALL